MNLDYERQTFDVVTKGLSDAVTAKFKERADFMLKDIKEDGNKWKFDKIKEKRCKMWYQSNSDWIIRKAQIDIAMPVGQILPTLRGIEERLKYFQ